MAVADAGRAVGQVDLFTRDDPSRIIRKEGHRASEADAEQSLNGLLSARAAGEHERNADASSGVCLDQIDTCGVESRRTRLGRPDGYRRSPGAPDQHTHRIGSVVEQVVRSEVHLRPLLEQERADAVLRCGWDRTRNVAASTQHARREWTTHRGL